MMDGINARCCLPLTRDAEAAAALLNTGRITAEIGGLSYSMYFYFEGGQLYKLTFESRPVSANLFGAEVTPHRDMLARVITASRGEPDFLSDVQFINLRPGVLSRTHLWQPNDDGVTHAVGLASGIDSRFYATLEIEWAQLADAVASEAEQQEQDAIEQSADDF